MNSKYERNGDNDHRVRQRPKYLDMGRPCEVCGKPAEQQFRKYEMACGP